MECSESFFVFTLFNFTNNFLKHFWQYSSSVLPHRFFSVMHSVASFNWVLEQEIDRDNFQQLTMELLQDHVPSLRLQLKLIALKSTYTALHSLPQPQAASSTPLHSSQLQQVAWVPFPSFSLVSLLIVLLCGSPSHTGCGLLLVNCRSWCLCGGLELLP